MIKSVDTKLRYSININNRDIVSCICINELNTLLEKAELVQLRLFIQSLTLRINREIGNDKPMKLSITSFNFSNCKDCNCCNTKCNF